MRTVALSLIGLCLVTAAPSAALAEVQVINGIRYECKDGLCVPVEDEPAAEATDANAPSDKAPRIAQGYMSADRFVAFLENKAEAPLGEAGLWVTLLLVLLGGLAMNLTPCVLPMIPINLMIIGKSAARGLWYGVGIALAYGVLGVAAAVGGLAFGTIQGNPWFNLCVSAVFVVLALALSDVFIIDFSRFRPQQAGRRADGRAVGQVVFPLAMGSLSAVLAGACVAPILISVLLLTGKQYAEGHVLALGLPFVFGLGMALPWPFLGAGLRVLPKPGAWMKWVNRLFAVLVLGFAAWYGRLAWQGFGEGKTDDQPSAEGLEWASLCATATPATFPSVLESLSAGPKKPILVDCWATWCKNCAAMDRVLGEAKVREALKGHAIVRLQAEDISELRRLKGFESVRGLPAFVIFE